MVPLDFSLQRISLGGVGGQKTEQLEKYAHNFLWEILGKPTKYENESSWINSL